MNSDELEVLTFNTVSSCSYSLLPLHYLNNLSELIFLLGAIIVSYLLVPSSSVLVHAY